MTSVLLLEKMKMMARQEGRNKEDMNEKKNILQNCKAQKSKNVFLFF